MGWLPVDAGANTLREAMPVHRLTGSSEVVQVEFCSAVNQRQYSIRVALPWVPPPKNGYPVLYVLDADWYFGSAVEAVQCNAPAAAVVGIGYPHDEAYVESVLARHEPLPVWAKEEPGFRVAVGLERMYDLSLPASDEVLSGDFPQRSRVRARDVGGLDAFIKVLETEIKPRVGGLMAMDCANQAIFGHSLGGLAVLHAMFVAPRAFRTFISASPSIWWNNKAVLKGEAKFAEAVRAGSVSPRVLITMGAEEETADPTIAEKDSLDFTEYAARIRRHRMVGNARELTERLRALRGTGAFEVEEFTVFLRQDHGTSPWPALGRAVSFAFPR